MPPAFRNPMAWAATVLIAVAVGVVVVGSSDDQPRLRDATRLSATISDLGDGVDSRGVDARSPTAGNLADRPVQELSGTPVFDDNDRCAWLVGVPGTDSGIRYLVGWPTGTELRWDPFRVVLPAPSPDDVLVPGDRVAGNGEIYGDLAELDDRDRARLLGLEDCPHEAVLLFEDRPDSLTVSPPAN